MKNTTLIFGIVILVALVGGFLYWENSRSNYTPTSNNDVPSSGDFQKVVISFKNYNYYPNTITVKAGKPVRVYLDNSVGGCYRSFNIRELDVSKYLATSNDYVEFTPTTAGRYKFECSMGMGTGTLIVE